MDRWEASVTSQGGCFDRWLRQSVLCAAPRCAGRLVLGAWSLELGGRWPVWCHWPKRRWGEAGTKVLVVLGRVCPPSSVLAFSPLCLRALGLDLVLSRLLFFQSVGGGTGRRVGKVARGRK